MSFRARVRKLDGVGMLTFTIGATATALPLSWADSLYDWSSWKTILPLIIGVSVLILFAIYERRQAEAVIPHRISNSVTSVASLVGAFVHGLVLYTMLSYLPLFFQAIWLETHIKAAVSKLPISCAVIAFSVIAPLTIELTRKYRIPLWLGWLMTVMPLGLWGSGSTWIKVPRDRWPILSRLCSASASALYSPARKFPCRQLLRGRRHQRCQYNFM